MSKATAGKKYTVVSGDSLSGIAAQAYGDQTKWPTIFKANQTELKSQNPDEIFPGEVIFIPELSELKKIKDEQSRFSGKEKDDLTIVLGNREIKVTDAKIFRPMNTPADGFSFKLAWEPGIDREMDELTRPYAYTPAMVYIGNERMVTGHMYTITPQLRTDGSSKSIICFSSTIGIVDSEAKPPYEKNNVTILQRAKEFMDIYGLQVVVADGVDIGGPFDRVTINKNEKMFAHLNKLAKERSLILSSTRYGNLLITKANVKSRSVGTIQEGGPGPDGWQATFDGRKRFSSYRVTGDSPLKFDKKVAIANDKNVPLPRFKNITANESTKGDMNSIAKWERSKAIADALVIPFPVDGWFAPNGKIWEENTLVTIKSPTLSVPNGFTFLIDKVTLNLESNRRSAVLDIVPPQVYTNEPVITPWD